MKYHRIFSLEEFFTETLLSSNSFISYYAYSLISCANHGVGDDEIKIISLFVLHKTCFQVSKRRKTISETIRQNHAIFKLEKKNKK